MGKKSKTKKNKTGHAARAKAPSQFAKLQKSQNLITSNLSVTTFEHPFPDDITPTEGWARYQLQTEREWKKNPPTYP